MEFLEKILSSALDWLCEWARHKEDDMMANSNIREIAFKIFAVMTIGGVIYFLFSLPLDLQF